MYNLRGENKGADQLRGYREADLRLCFRICKTLFSHEAAHIILTLGRPVLVVAHKCKQKLVLFSITLVCPSQGLNLVPSDLRVGTLPTEVPNRAGQTVLPD